MRDKSINSYDFYNMIEKSVLEMEGEESSRLINDAQLQKYGILKDDLSRLV